MTTQKVTVLAASFDVAGKEGKKRIFNATNGASLSLKNLEDKQVLEITEVLIHEGVNNDGEKNTVTTLFAADGESYAGISATVADAAQQLIEYKEISEEETLQVKIVKGKSQAGREFLNLQLV